MTEIREEPNFATNFFSQRFYLNAECSRYSAAKRSKQMFK
jgi:hypothetical protein